MFLKRFVLLGFPGVVFAASWTHAEEAPRVISANETFAAAACKSYAMAQDIYRRTDWDRDGFLEYAQSIKGGTPVADVDGDAEKSIPEPTAEAKAALPALIKGLASEDFAGRERATAELEKLGPSAIKPLREAIAASGDVETRTRCENVVANLKRGLIKGAPRDTMFGLYQDKNQKIVLLSEEIANAEGEPGDPGTPKRGYRFKILLAQGTAASGGARSYLANLQPGASTQNMTSGHALIAYPAEYGKMGRRCFMISNAGTIYEADLGKDTLKAVEETHEFNPDRAKGWKVLE